MGEIRVGHSARHVFLVAGPARLEWSLLDMDAMTGISFFVLMHFTAVKRVALGAIIPDSSTASARCYPRMVARHPFQFHITLVGRRSSLDSTWSDLSFCDRAVLLGGGQRNEAEEFLALDAGFPF